MLRVLDSGLIRNGFQFRLGGASIILSSPGGIQVGKGFPMLRSKRQNCLSAIANGTPIKPGYCFVRFIKKEVYPPLYSVACLHVGSNISMIACPLSRHAPSGRAPDFRQPDSNQPNTATPW